MTRSPIYHTTTDRGQMREVGTTANFELEIHELGDNGEPLCGPKRDSWRGEKMVLVVIGPGPVTCKSCARITGH